MARIKKRWIEEKAIDDSKILLTNDGYVKARNAANSADVSIIKLNTSDQIELASDAYVGVNKVQTAADKGVANGIASLDAAGKVPSSQLPSFVDDVEEYANLAAFPVTGETGKIYVAIDNGKTYRWSGSVYTEISPSEVNSVNGQTGVVVLNTSHISESGSLYFTEARVRSTPLTGLSLLDSTDVVATDTVLQGMGKLQAQIDNFAAADAEEEVITLTSTNITNGYIDLAFHAMNGSIHVIPDGGPTQVFNVDYTVNYTGGPSGVSRITFAGDLASVLAAGHILMVKYLKA